MNKDLKETMLMAADYTDDHIKKVLKRYQVMFGAATVCGIFYLVCLFFELENISPVFNFISGVCLGIMFGMLILGIFVTDKNFSRFAEWKHSKIKKITE